MKACNVCSEFIKSEGPGDKGMICPECEVNYCFKCSATVTNCIICGTETIPYYPEFDPSLKLQKSIYSNERKHPRNDYVTTFEYILDPTVTRVKAVTKDISKGGLCIYTQEEHEKGQRIKITESTICSGHTDAEVRWSQKVDEEIFRVGLKFIE
jgi:hypothetical protein